MCCSFCVLYCCFVCGDFRGLFVCLFVCLFVYLLTCICVCLCGALLVLEDKEDSSTYSSKYKDEPTILFVYLNRSTSHWPTMTC